MTKEEQIAELMEIIQSMMNYYQKLADPDFQLRHKCDVEVKKTPPRAYPSPERRRTSSQRKLANWTSTSPNCRCLGSSTGY